MDGDLFLKGRRDSGAEAGFTLVEVLITMIIAMVILGGLLLSFQTQYKEYKYQNKRTDAVQDLEFALRFVGDDIRAGMWSATGDSYSSPSFSAVSGTLPAGITSDATGEYTFWAWDQEQVESELGTSSAYDAKRARRKFVFDYNNETLNYDRMVATIVGGNISTTGIADSTGSSSSAILNNVTFFKVFEDGVTSRTGYTGIPNALGELNLGVINEDGDPITGSSTGGVTYTGGAGDVSVRVSDSSGFNVPAYTILIEVAVDAAYKDGSFTNARGVDVRTFESPARKRVWRYIQIHPRVLMP